MTLRNNDTQKLELFRKTVQRFAFTCNLLGAGAMANVLLDLVNCKMILKRGGVEHVIFHENLQLLAQESSFFNGFEHAISKTGILLATNSYILPLIVDLGSPINLQGDDNLTLEVTTKTGWYGTFDAGQSSIEVEYREAIGVELAIPFIRSKSIQATVGRINESLGDNITSITLMNTEASRTGIDAEKVFDAVILTSDKWNVSDNRGRLLARRVTQFETVAAAAARKENFRYVPKAELDGVSITIELTAANVVSSKNFLVYRTYLPTRETLYRAQDMTAKHQRRNEAKLAESL